MLDIDFIQNLIYTLQKRQAFLGYLWTYLIPLLIVIAISLLLGWWTRKSWREKKHLVISIIVFLAVGIFLTVAGVGFGRPSLINDLYLVYFLIVAAYWLSSLANKIKKKSKALVLIVMPLIGFGIVFLLATIFANNFISNKNRVADSRITAEMSQIRAKAERIASKEGGYSQLSCNYDNALSALCDDIDKQCIYIREGCKGDDVEGGKQDVIIHSVKNKYCAYTPLPNSSMWYCINNKRKADYYTNINPGNGYCTENSFKCPKQTE